MSKTFLISDLHLSPAYPATVQRFHHFLQQLPDSTDALYILGDLFDAWTGDDNDVSPYPEIRHALKKTTSRGIAVFIQHGNRDFLLGEVFCSQTGATLIADEYVAEISGKLFLLMHGDTLCTDDLAYQQARQFLRSEQFISDFLSRSVQERNQIASEYRKKSGEATSLLAADIMDVNQQAVISVMQAHNVDVLIHGHTHRQNIHTFDIQNRQYQRIVLGEWHADAGMALLITPESIEQMIV